ncbi:myosin regulatory light chain 1 [Trichoderma asperellum]|uniref:Myosin regulatory light chain 1 n=1 Tax=Trichoderma asperellum TaxID=101201 RepID=A0A6V8QHW1_TRIAP|nr:myosin regulatory light chain 1 [Trichoderma asperellum]
MPSGTPNSCKRAPPATFTSHTTRRPLQVTLTTEPAAGFHIQDQSTGSISLTTFSRLSAFCASAKHQKQLRLPFAGQPIAGTVTAQIPYRLHYAAATTPNGTSRFARPTTPTNDLPETKEQEKTPVMTTPTRASPPSWKAGSKLAVGGSLGGSNALSQLQPTQQGLPSGSSDIGRFFPPSKPQTITLAAFLNSMAESLALLSPNTELLSAFSAFDEDDSGQIDWAELRDALLNTPPEAGQSALSAAEVDKVVEGFTGRRAFNRNMNAHLSARRGEVFKYQEFVHSIMGSNGGSEGGAHEGEEQ